MGKKIDLKPKAEKKLTGEDVLKLRIIKLRRDIVELKKNRENLTLICAQEKRLNAQLLEELSKTSKQDMSSEESNIQSEFNSMLEGSGIEDATIEKRNEDLFFRKMTDDEKKASERFKILSGN